MEEKEIAPKGRFVKGQSGNPAGRPKGSKNQITLLKLMAEEAVRGNNMEAMQEVCNLIIEQAMDGHAPSQKLVWQAVVSNGVSDEKSAAEKVQINISGVEKPKEVTVIDNPPQEEL